MECQDIDEAELFHRRTELHQAETTASEVATGAGATAESCRSGERERFMSGTVLGSSFYTYKHHQGFTEAFPSVHEAKALRDSHATQTLSGSCASWAGFSNGEIIFVSMWRTRQGNVHRYVVC